MNTALLLDMAADTWLGRAAVSCAGRSFGYDELRRLASTAARRLREEGARSLAFLDVNGPAAAVAMYAAARAGVPYVPLNYRLSRDELEALLARLDAPMLVAAQSTLAGLRLPPGSSRDGVRHAPAARRRTMPCRKPEPARIPMPSPCSSSPAAPPVHPRPPCSVTLT